MRLDRIKILLAAFALTGLFTMSASADTLHAAGLGDATVAATSLTFGCFTGTCPAGYGDVRITGFTPDPGSLFQNNGLTAGQTGFIHNLNNSIAPVNETFSLPNFLEFNSGGTGLVFNLSRVEPGTFGQAGCLASPAAGGQICTPVVPALITPANPTGLSPYDLANSSATSSSATFVVGGTVVNSSNGLSAPFQGTFSASFSDKSFQQILQDLQTGSINKAYQLDFTANIGSFVPEPGTTSAMLGGLLILAGLGTRRFRRKQQ